MFTVETIVKLQRHAESTCDFEIIFGNTTSLLEELQIKTFFFVIKHKTALSLKAKIEMCFIQLQRCNVVFFVNYYHNESSMFFLDKLFLLELVLNITVA